MSEAAKQTFPLDHPTFMDVLGLSTPCELADVKAAYHTKALVSHPDRGGDPADFIRIKEAYDQAVEYVTFRGIRREWIAAQVEPYLDKEEVIADVLRRGGHVKVERIGWMEKLWGDGFTHLSERLRDVSVRDMVDGDSFLAFLADHPPRYLMSLDVAGSRVSGEGLRHLADFDVMCRLNVSGTDVDYPALRSLLSCLPSLEWLNVRKTRLGWWGRMQLRRTHPELRIVTEISPAVMPGTEIME